MYIPIATICMELVYAFAAVAGARLQFMIISRRLRILNCGSVGGSAIN